MADLASWVFENCVEVALRAARPQHISGKTRESPVSHLPRFSWIQWFVMMDACTLVEQQSLTSGPDPHLRTRNFTHLRTPVSKMSLTCAPSSSLILEMVTALSSLFAVRWGGVVWGGVGWDNNAHVPVHTQAPQPHHLSCSRTDTGTALSWSVTRGVGWGGTITFMFLCTLRHRNLIICLAVLQTQALLFHVFMISYRWGGVGSGGVGWGGTITFMFLCTHRHSNLIIFLAVLQTQALLFHAFMISYRWGGVGWGGTKTF